MRLYNSLSRQVEELGFDESKMVNLYVCGVTPYSAAHLGHAMCAVVFDVLRRYLEYEGYTVIHIQNFTDVDDKMIDAASDQEITVDELAERNISDYLEEMKSLNVKSATHYPRATQEIPSIISLIEGLIEKQYAYERNGDVYFRVRKNDDYGKLSGRNLEDLMSGARIEPSESKEYPGDFVLWKKKKPGEPNWDSPWGQGRPGWHIECSAMSLSYLDNRIDIHGGGRDLIFPHHENEIAQSESYTGSVPFSKFWVHNGTLNFDGDKMSKSLGNIYTTREAISKFSPDALRMFFLTSHYRSPLLFSEDSINSQERALARLRNSMSMPSGTGDVLNAAPYLERFTRAMNQDLNTPQALGAIFDLARAINRSSDENGDVDSCQQELSKLSAILGLTLKASESSLDKSAYPFIDLLVNVRTSLRVNQQFALSDLIRDELSKMGVSVHDSQLGSEWDFE